MFTGLRTPAIASPLQKPHLTTPGDSLACRVPPVVYKGGLLDMNCVSVYYSLIHTLAPELEQVIGPHWEPPRRWWSLRFVHVVGQGPGSPNPSCFRGFSAIDEWGLRKTLTQCPAGAKIARRKNASWTWDVTNFSLIVARHTNRRCSF